MKITQSFKMAFSAILANKMRSFLTMLGVIIGVFAVVVLISIGEGAQNMVMEQFDGLGTNLISVQTMSYRNTMSLADMDEILEIEGVQYCAPMLNGSAYVRGNGESVANATLYATTFDYVDAYKYDLHAGRNINLTDAENRFNVVIIGSEIADEIFGYQDVVGEKIRINGTPFKIVGVFEEQEESLMGTNGNTCVIPITVGERMLQTKDIRMALVATDEGADVNKVKSEVEKLVKQKVGEDNYYVQSSQEMLSIMDTMMGTLTGMLGGIAAISLLVGGIGIMNIMLVSVTERTREIGIRKAIGAKRSNILTQFLIEAIVITVIGGILSLVLSYVTLIFVGDAMGTDVSMSTNTMMLGIIFCIVIGLVFGVYPANKASKMNPIEALRYE